MHTCKETHRSFFDHLLYGVVTASFVTFVAIMLYILPNVMDLFLNISRLPGPQG